MKYTKSIIGKIAFIETDANYKDSLKKIPKEARIMKAWELLRIQIENKESLKDFPEYKYVWTENRASWLYDFGGDSDFIAVGRVVGLHDDSLRGVCVVKK